jgi:hypothetical protein
VELVQRIEVLGLQRSDPVPAEANARPVVLTECQHRHVPVERHTVALREPLESFVADVEAHFELDDLRRQQRNGNAP